MNIRYPDTLQTENGEAGVLHAVSKQLEEIAGASVIPASAEWELDQDRGGNRRFNLKLSDYLGQMSGSFTPAELHSPRQVRRRLIRLWGDHLQMRSHKLLENLSQGE